MNIAQKLEAIGLRYLHQLLNTLLLLEAEVEVVVRLELITVAVAALAAIALPPGIQ